MMSWKFEIYRAFFVAFGAMQTISNLTYLLKKNGIDIAKKQHKELPDTASPKQLKTKVICMLLFGILFLATGLISSFTRSFNSLSFAVVLGMYALYALVEAVYYKFWRTVGAFVISSILFIIFVI